MEEAVSVRGGMLAILTIGPAYGSQLLSEFQRRAVHRAPVNVGQAYTTLDRLSKQGLVETAGTTADGLTLFALTEAGRVAADAWLRDASGSMGSDNWDEMLDRVLIARSLPNSPHDALIKSYAALWKQRGAIRNPASNARTPHDHEGTNLVARANALVADAALDWLHTVSRTEATAVSYSSEKPLRGRRPNRVTGQQVETASSRVEHTT